MHVLIAFVTLAAISSVQSKMLRCSKPELPSLYKKSRKLEGENQLEISNDLKGVFTNQSTKYACSKIPELARLYEIAVEIGSWKPMEIPKIQLDEDFDIEGFVDLIVEYKQFYENHHSESGCNQGLCEQAYLEGRIVHFPTKWKKVPQKYRLVLEDFADQTTNYLNRLTPEHCKNVIAKTYELADMAKSLPKINYSNYSGSLIERYEPEIDKFVRLFEEVDKTNCARMFYLGEFSASVWGFRVEFWESVLDMQLKQVKDFVKYSEKIYENLAKLNPPITVQCI